MWRELRRSSGGFSLVDMIIVVGLLGVIFGIAIPVLTNAVDAMRLGQAAREVERELQSARQRAVGKGRAIRVRFNCPGPGEYRSVELIGHPRAPAPADSAANRCSPAVYPYPAPDQNPLTLPNEDGPLRWVDRSVSFVQTQSIEFWPDGTARYQSGTATPWPVIPTSGVSITLTRKGKTATIRVNGIGRILLER